MKMPACDRFLEVRPTRRSFVVAGSIGLFGPTLPQALSADVRNRTRVKSCILLYMFGGPSHLDTFDMKLNAPTGIRGEFAAIASKTPGVPVCEHLPRMARLSDKYALLRAVHHTTGNHNPASYYALTGHPQRTDDVTANATANDYPAYGSVVARWSPPAEQVPAFVALPSMIADGPFRTPGEFAGMLGKQFDPLWVLKNPNSADFRGEDFKLPDGVDKNRVAERRSLRDELASLGATGAKWTQSSAAVAGSRAYRERAFALLSSDRTRTALEVDREAAATRDRYGRTTFGQSALVARRLVEAGVRFVTVYYSPGIGGWDTHEENFSKLKGDRLPNVDAGMSALIEDLEQRGLLDETLVIWMGEFGRTPKINKKAGRDHWPNCYTVLMAGGGVPPGLLYGSSDSIGALPKDKPVKPDDLAATIFHKFGIDHAQTVLDHFGQTVKLAYGEPIADLG